MLLGTMRGKRVSSPTEKLDEEGSLDVTSQKEECSYMWGKLLVYCSAQQRLSPGSFYSTFVQLDYIHPLRIVVVWITNTLSFGIYRELYQLLKDLIYSKLAYLSRPPFCCPGGCDCVAWRAALGSSLDAQIFGCMTDGG